ncbi:MAG: bifunctional adenosylcobinamide kinase/adenosylcobinamide-phosphate guanylyltransferase [Nitrospinales bacterium]
MNKNSILITGGCRSGKSNHALTIGNSIPGNKVFLATAQARDQKMKTRIEKHKKDRGDNWVTVEEPISLLEKLTTEGKNADVIIIDCLTLWISNLLESRTFANEVLNHCEQLAFFCNAVDCHVIVITNEVGSGIIPISPLGREFQDLAGSCNQFFAKTFNVVICMISGIPVTIKSVNPNL